LGFYLIVIVAVIVALMLVIAIGRLGFALGKYADKKYTFMVWALYLIASAGIVYLSPHGEVSVQYGIFFIFVVIPVGIAIFIGGLIGMAKRLPFVDSSTKKIRSKFRIRLMRGLARRRSDLQRMKSKSHKVRPWDKKAVNANHLKECSCWMCGNPRKYSGEATIQERKASTDPMNSLL
jgi:hypothetical protein